VIRADGQTICSDAGVTTIGNQTLATGGVGAISYQWRHNGDDISTATASTYAPTAFRSTTGAHTFTRWAKDGECPYWTQSAGTWVLTVNLVPGTPTVGGGGVQCEGTLEITATPGTNGDGILWTNDNSTESTRNVGSGTWNAVSTTNEGCSSTVKAVTVVIGLTVGEATINGNSTNDCPNRGTMLTATATNATSYTWYQGATQVQTGSNNSYKAIVAAQYSFKAWNPECATVTANPFAYTITPCYVMSLCNDIELYSITTTYDGSGTNSGNAKCPTGWRVTTRAEFDCLLANYNMLSEYGGLANAQYVSSESCDAYVARWQRSASDTEWKCSNKSINYVYARCVR
jgi:hypothetical protein